MANTRSSAKRARQEDRRQLRNKRSHSKTKTAVKKAIAALTEKNVETAKTAYQEAIKALAKAGRKRVIPSQRASRKISRLTQLALRVLPEAVGKSATLAKK